MNLKSLKLVNFKKFKNINIDLTKRIIVLVGPNSVGKTSIIKAILALKQTFSKENDDEVFCANGSLVDLGQYEDYIFDHKKNNEFSFDGEIDVENEKIAYTDAVESIKFKIEYFFDSFSESASLKSLVFKIKTKKGIATISADGKFSNRNSKAGAEYSIVLRDSEFLGEKTIFSFFEKENKHLSKTKQSFKLIDQFRFEPQKQGGDEEFTYLRLLSMFMDELIKCLRRCFDDNFSYIGPLREKPNRFYVRDNRLKYVGPAGEYTASVLTNLYIQNKYKEIFKEINKDFYELFSKKVSVKRSDEVTRLRIVDEARDSDESISDVGFGISQILPIITQKNLLTSNQRLILEQPELHLHPQTQTMLASLLLKKSDNQKKYIIETHSEHLIRGIQLAIKKSSKTDLFAQDYSISNSDVDILYFGENVDSEIYARQLKLDEKGELIDKWPAGFFDQAYKFTLEMMK